ncbi:uncharacterized protein LOC133887039 isoform X1 [Phragmites australis]|uniref:uncharacterized protein LOC133887039 isoform X1 n=1 Tax=Phragmites australis TaxID=29695 RepID=UPI002D79B53D|nr:uncharacterized protein LOC133887039 isoform X1 [Phragmites australis]
MSPIRDFLVDSPTDPRARCKRQLFFLWPPSIRAWSAASCGPADGYGRHRCAGHISRVEQEAEARAMRSKAMAAAALFDGVSVPVASVVTSVGWRRYGGQWSWLRRGGPCNAGVMSLGFRGKRKGGEKSQSKAKGGDWTVR